MTQSDLAQQSGIPQPNLSNIEKGKVDLTVTTLSRIAFALKVRPTYFFEEHSREKKKMTRARIESLARFVVHDRVPKGKEDQFLVESLRLLLPRKEKAAVSIRELHETWLKLHDRYSSAEIETLIERVQDEQRRSS